MRSGRQPPRVLVALALAVVAASPTVWAQRPEETEIAASDTSPLESPRRFGLGLYPGMSGVLGFPNLTSYQGSLYLSFKDHDRYSFYIGYGEERGSTADAGVYTLGWGGVRRLHSGAPQRGFYGRFLRYRRWDDRDHGIHHGLSFGAETGVGLFSFTWELGAARSDRNHWMATAQVSLKIALPVYIPFGARAPAVPEYNQGRER